MSDSTPIQNAIIPSQNVTRPDPVVIAKDSPEPTETLYCEDLQVGDEWLSPWRTISANDVRAFSELTGDFDPLHDEDENGESLMPKSPFGRPVAHGLLGLSVLAGLSTEYPRAATLALVSVSDWNFAELFTAESVRGEASQRCKRGGRITGRGLCQDRRIHDSQVGHSANIEVGVHDASQGTSSGGVIKRL